MMTPKNNSLEKLHSVLIGHIKSAESIGILMHTNPDGDALASALALQEICAEIYGQEVDIILEEPAPATFNFMETDKRTRVYHSELCYALIIILDCHEISRIGICHPLVEKADCIIAIDHHEQGDLIENAHNYIDTSMASVGVIIYLLFASEIPNLPKNSATYVANMVYASILNDTDNFINSNVDARTYMVSSELMSYGMDPGHIAQMMFMNRPVNYYRFVGKVLSNIETFHDDSILLLVSSLDMLKHYRVSNEATMKMTRWVKGANGVKVIVYIQQEKANLFRISLRSNYYAVNKIAEMFGGGGHSKAAGCIVEGSLEYAKNAILDQLDKLMKNG